ncbi:hypothetical protein FNV43_RR12407 [Rhamnella rubrinervis]|uniref:Pectinesterase inhibitor domain-containing protein n=1 Tax=Rhamnella rubrinervis TaxID=2594499 RepID=A0A8K0H7A5_9ROSA|nr:hypothetical protein FNV43_RR12407 [Rhamnella rubrinervis]
MLLLLPLLCSPSHARDLLDINIPILSNLLSPKTICKDTPFPSICLSTLPNKKSNVFDFGKFAFKYSQSQSLNLLNLVTKQLQGSSSSSSFPLPTIRALQDCQSLASLNQDFLSTSFQTVNSTSKTLPFLDASNVQTQISAILTNLKTCSDGLSSSSLGLTKNIEIKILLATLLNVSKLLSVTLALFLKAWMPDQHTNQLPPSPPRFRSDGRLPLRVSSQNRALFESVILKRSDLNGVEEAVIKRKGEGIQGSVMAQNDEISCDASSSSRISIFLISLLPGYEFSLAPQ